MLSSQSLLLLGVSVLLLGCSGPSSSREGRHQPPPKLDFKQMDVDGDGRLSEREFLQFAPPVQTPEKLFVMLDKDGDGFVSKAELEDAPRPPRPPQGPRP
ncbi:hypothetical protein [Atopomonas sediminilitoris]|uniref:hypothetical protein n=1 Tax=Atopomonas sediminilitoris TaxID=2919919 RepID=UPI001F4D6121|nr:hypothetical protein [Atopomonas sediminilitoris]MCJ8170599.1 hypothetical protein [Atopomonas sediminilitoris]